MSEFLLIDHFQPHVGKIFRFKGTRYALPLTASRPILRRRVPQGMKRKPFILIFARRKSPSTCRRAATSARSRTARPTRCT